MFQNFLPQAAAVKVGVDFRGADALMSEHALYGPQVGSSLQQMGGKRVSESVGADGLFQAGLCGQFLDDMKHHDARDVLPEPADEHKVLVSRFDESLVSVGKIELQFVDGPWGNRYQPLLASLSFHPDKLFFQVQVRKPEVAQFRYTQSAAVERFQNGPVALSFA